MAGRSIHDPGLHPDQPGLEPGQLLLHRPECAGAVGGRRRPFPGSDRARLPAVARRPVRDRPVGPTVPGNWRCSSSTRSRWGRTPAASGGPIWSPGCWPPSRPAGPTPACSEPRPRPPTISAGGYQQGLALAALAAAGVHNASQLSSAIGWLVAEQCPDGGWTTPDNANNPCNGTPADFAGPDTNSTALALEGLAAQGAITPAVSAGALAFLGTGQDADGGWSLLSEHQRHARHQRSRLDRVGDPVVDRHRRGPDQARCSPRGRPIRCPPCCPSS